MVEKRKLIQKSINGTRESVPAVLQETHQKKNNLKGSKQLEKGLRV